MTKRAKHELTPTTSEDGTCSDVTEERSPKRAAAPANSTSQFRGVTKHRHTLKWEAHLWDSDYVRSPQEKGGKGKARRHGRQVYLGGYGTEEEAAQAYDRASLVWWGKGTPLNFVLETYENELDSLMALSREEVVQELRRRSTTFARGHSRYRGVTQHTQGVDGKWDARIGRVNGNKYKFLGTFPTDLEAAVAYDLATLTHHTSKAITNFPAILYRDDKSELLPLEECTKRCTEYHTSTVQGKTANAGPPALIAATAVRTTTSSSPKTRTSSKLETKPAAAKPSAHATAVQALRQQLKAVASSAASQAASGKTAMLAPAAKPRPSISKEALLQQHVQQRMQTIAVPPPDYEMQEDTNSNRAVTTMMLPTAASMQRRPRIPTAPVTTITTATTNTEPQASATLLANPPPLMLTSFDGTDTAPVLASVDLDAHVSSFLQPAYAEGTTLAPLPTLPSQPQQGMSTQDPMMHRVLDLLSLPSRALSRFSQFSQFLGRTSNPGSSVFVTGTSLSMPPPPLPAIHAASTQLMTATTATGVTSNADVLPGVALPMPCQNVLVANLQDSVYEEMLNALLAPAPGEAAGSSCLAGWDDTALLLLPNRARRAGSSGSILLAAGPPAGVPAMLQGAPSGALGQPSSYFI